MLFSITNIIIALNVLVFIYLSQNPSQINRLMLMADRVRERREYDRLFLSGFTHADIIHLLVNMLALWSFGQVLEPAINGTLYLLLFLGSIVAGNLFCLFMRKEERLYAALGASGGVLGVIYGAILVNPDAGISLLFLPFGIPGWIFGIIFSLTSIFLTQLKRAEAARISHEGHLGGAVFGAVMTIALTAADGFSLQQYYFIAGGVIPIILFGLVKLLAPGLLYKHLR